MSAFCKKLELFLCLKCCNLGHFLAEASGGVCLFCFFCVFGQGAENLCGFGEGQKERLVYWIYNYISSCHKSILSRAVWRSRKADNVRLIKYSLLGWIQDCEIWTGSLNVFWESRNNLSVKLIPMTINQFGMFSNSSRKQINGK